MARDMEIPSDAPRPRLCHMIKRDDFNGYGFNLHAQKARPGQFIGIVDAGSPAEVAGLREGDRIIEVNGTNIAHENHRQVVERIKAIPNETTLLVVDKATEDYYRKLDVIVSKDLPNVDRKSSGLTMEAHAEPDSTTTLCPEPEIEEKVPDEPEAEDVAVVGKVASFRIDEEEAMDEAEEPDNDVTRRLSSRSSTSSAEKVVVAVAEDEEKDVEFPEIETLKQTNEAETNEDDEEVKGEIEDKKEKENEEKIKMDELERENAMEQKKIEENLAKMEQEEREREEREREEEQAKKEREEEEMKKIEREREEERKREREEKEMKEKEEKKRKEQLDADQADSGKEDSEKTLSIGSESGSSLRSTPSPQPRSTTKLEIPPATASPTSSPTTPVSPSSASNWDGLNLNMTAAEMREMIGAKKKKDPRKDKSLDFRKKFEIIQTL